MSQPNPAAELTELHNNLKELGYSTDAINNMEIEEKVEFVSEEIPACDICHGEKVVEELEHVSGDNLPPGGMWEGSGTMNPCICQNDSLPDEPDLDKD